MRAMPYCTLAKAHQTYQWELASKLKRANDPLCEICLAAGQRVPARQVDHIKPIAHGGAMYDMANLQSLCNDCAEAKNAEDRLNPVPFNPGGWPL